MTALAEINTATRRLTILRLLSEAPGAKANSAVLDTALDEMGVGAARAQVEADMAWLHDQGLVRVSAIGPVTVAAITQLGLDVAAGEARHEGVARPTPRF